MDAWSDDEIERMAATDSDHPALDDAFWAGVDAKLVSERSYVPLSDADLRQLASIGLAWINDLAVRNSGRPSGTNRSSLRLIALAQGAALHFVDRHNGIKDFDLWAFFAQAEGLPPFPHKPVWHADFGRSRFGTHPDDASTGYSGRRVDLIGRTIPFGSDADPVGAVEQWLGSGTRSATLLGKRPLVIVYPEPLLGKVVEPSMTHKH